MSQVLHLGVIDVHYTEGEPVAKYRQRLSRSRKSIQPIRRSNSGEMTTGDVADILEQKYQLFTAFYEHHEEEIADQLASDFSDSLDGILAGAPIGQNVFGAFEQNLGVMFRKAIETREFDTYGIPGVPTKASLRGVNHRLKRKRGPDRPSFRDTGLMEASFLAWVDPR